MAKVGRPKKVVTVDGRQGPRGPMTEAHKKAIAKAMKKRWKVRQASRQQVLQFEEPTAFTAEPDKVAVYEARPKTIMAVISEIDLTMAALNKLHRELDDLIGD